MSEAGVLLSEKLPPYARSMGMRIAGMLDDAPLLAMDFSDRAMGRPGFLHGGAIAGMMEIAAIMALHAHLGEEDARTVETFARGEVIRAGRRIANVRAEAWQSDRDKPLASCWMNFLIKPKS